MMKEFIRFQYILKNITQSQVLSFVPRYITQKQAEDIINNR